MDNPPALGPLRDPHRFHDPVTLDGLSPEVAQGFLRQMLVIRLVEEKIGDKVVEGKVRCPCHLGIGQEAIAAGISLSLRPPDRVFGGHRSHAHYLGLGGSVFQLFAEVLGKDAGCSRGMGGSMHLFDGAHGFLGSVPIVAATVPLAVGAALAAKKDGGQDVAVSYFGDGAAEEGVVHESLNFAATFRLPVLFVCENNLFSSHLHIDLRQPSDAVCRFAAAHRIPYELVDGNDVTAVWSATVRLLTGIREGRGPGFLEAVTYRWRGHVGPGEDMDVGVKRKDDLTLWKRRDPIRRLREAMQAAGWLGPRENDLLEAAVREEIEAAWAEAESAPYPPPDATLGRVYAGDSCGR